MTPDTEALLARAEAADAEWMHNTTFEMTREEYRRRAWDYLMLIRDTGAALRASVQAQERQGWRSIESAPRDGTQILVLEHGAVVHVKWTDFHRAWVHCKGLGFADCATHWLPLDSLPPPPPTGGEG